MAERQQGLGALLQREASKAGNDLTMQFLYNAPGEPLSKITKNAKCHSSCH